MDVDSTSPAEVRAFTLRTEGGEQVTFEVGPLDLPAGAFPASHLQEHLATAEPVRVEYRREGERLIAVALFDATEP